MNASSTTNVFMCSNHHSTSNGTAPPPLTIYKHTQPTISPFTLTLEMTVLLSSPLDNLTIINSFDIKFWFFSQMFLVCCCVTPGCTQCLGNIFSASKQYPFASLLFTAHACCAFPIDACAQVSDEREHMWSSLNMFGLICCL